MERRQVTFEANFVPIKELNEEFTLAKCYIMALGTNRNGSVISKEATDAALPTLWNVPVIANLYTDADGKYVVGGHDMALEVDANGELRFKSMCVPFGVVPERPDEVKYEEVEEPDGRGVHTYLTAPVILWTGRFPELKEAYVDQSRMFGQSMEISVDEYEAYSEDANYTNITKYAFSALCLLGEGVEPCFPCASVETYEASDNDFVSLMEQFKLQLAGCFAADTSEHSDETTYTEEAVETEAEEETAEAVEEQTAETAEQQPDENFSSAAAEPDTESDAEQTEEHHEEALAFALTYRDKAEAIRNALPGDSRKYDPATGEVIAYVYYCLCDFDDTFVYIEKCIDMRDGYQVEHYRAKYTCDPETGECAVSEEFEPVSLKWVTADEQAAIDALRADYEALKTYKENREEEDRRAAIDGAMAEFSDLSGIEAFDALNEKKYSYETADAVRDACYIIRGKFAAPAPRRIAREPEVPVGNFANETITYRDRLHKEFGHRG